MSEKNPMELSPLEQIPSPESRNVDKLLYDFAAALRESGEALDKITAEKFKATSPEEEKEILNKLMGSLETPVKSTNEALKKLSDAI